MLYLGWIAAAFLAGVVCAMLRGRRRSALRKRAETVASFGACATMK